MASEYKRLTELLTEFKQIEQRRTEIQQEVREIHERFNADLVGLGLPTLFNTSDAAKAKVPRRPDDDRLSIAAGKAVTRALNSEMPEEVALAYVLKAIERSAKKHRLEISQKVIDRYTEELKQLFAGRRRIVRRKSSK